MQLQFYPSHGITSAVFERDQLFSGRWVFYVPFEGNMQAEKVETLLAESSIPCTNYSICNHVYYC